MDNTSTKPLKRAVFCFDIDGTLSDSSHRQHLVQSGGKKNWKEFFERQKDDEPYRPLFKIFNALISHGALNILLTGRNEEHRHVTEHWLRQHGLNYNPSWLYMRPDGNTEDDHEWKFRKVQELLKENPDWEIQSIFEDRHRIIDKFREAGYHVFECNQTRNPF